MLDHDIRVCGDDELIRLGLLNDDLEQLLEALRVDVILGLFNEEDFALGHTEIDDQSEQTADAFPHGVKGNGVIVTNLQTRLFTLLGLICRDAKPQHRITQVKVGLGSGISRVRQAIDLRNEVAQVAADPSSTVTVDDMRKPCHFSLRKISVQEIVGLTCGYLTAKGVLVPANLHCGRLRSQAIVGRRKPKDYLRMIASNLVRA
ncbi:hypothetical protein OG439_46265 [Amycolatopsis sp. NBC_01307]|nr:hypothetical protein OG439_46265 [Amycolatopsis sp. NBC_01307]